MGLRVFTSVVLGKSKVTFLEDSEDAPICPSVYCVLVIYGVTESDQYVVTFPCFPQFCTYFVKPCCFLILIFLSTESSSSCVNCLRLMYSQFLIICVIGSSVTFRGFPSNFPKCFFHSCIHSSWLAVFSLALAVFFLLLTLITVCHAILDCLSSTVSLILLIRFCTYSVCSSRYTLVHYVSS